MSARFVVTGTDTGIGKTVLAAGLAAALGASYWKPVQSGLDGETDTQAVRRLAELPPERIVPEAYRLSAPLSPHRAAELDGVTIDIDRLAPPDRPEGLVIEGAGGVLVPLSREVTFADLFARWRWPVVLAARTTLGTINHSLGAIEALRRRAVPLLGIVFIGEAAPDSEAVIAELGQVRRLGRLPRLDPLTPGMLKTATCRHLGLAALATQEPA
jgi:dethiobiotin synthetase